MIWKKIYQENSKGASGYKLDEKQMIGPEDYDYEVDASDSDIMPEGKMINGQWVDIEDLPRGYGNSPDWWDDDGFGETYEEYLEHTD